MKTSRLRWFLLFLLVGAVFQLPAQQNEADRKLLADLRAKAEAGDAQSEYELGTAFANGSLGVARDEAEAVKWLRKAARQNYMGAQNNLGVCYGMGRGVPKEEVEAVKWYRKAAEQNCAGAQHNLGVCYYNGRGVAKDEAEAVKWYRKAAEQNHALAQNNLGLCYQNGQGVAKDEAEAVKWYRKAAEQNDGWAQGILGSMYANGEGVQKDEVEAVKWYRKAAEKNHVLAQFCLGMCYYAGEGVAKDSVEAVKWLRKAAEQNDTDAQCNLGVWYGEGQGVAKDSVEAVKWYRKAAEQNHAKAQFNLGVSYRDGQGVAKDYVDAYKWSLLASAQGDEDARRNVTILEYRMTREQIAEGQKLARYFKPREVPTAGGDSSAASIAQTRPESSGTGFFITEDGYLITNQHVAGNGAQVRLVTEAGLISAKVVKVDAANDLALLKAEGKFAALPVAPSRAVKMGSTVATVGFPNVGLQGFAPKLAKGEIASLSGAQDDPRYFQISVPVQPGNSGGALVDERGNVVGLVSAKLNVAAAVATSGALPENVNYAVKSSFLLSFLESVPEVAAKLKEPNTKDRKFEDVVKSAEQAAVLVLVY
jgi:TPR repeat protein